MTIRQRGTGYQVDLRWNGERVQRQAESLEHAQKLEQELLEDLKNRVPAPGEAKPWSLGDAYDRTWERCWEGSKSERTAKTTAGLAIKHFGRLTLLQDISSDDIDAWVSKMKKEGNSNGTINRKLASLSKMMTVAIQRGGLKTKPFMERETESLGRIRWVTPEEEAAMLALLESWGKYDHVDAIKVLLDIGCRCGELWRVQARDVHEATGMLAIWENKADHPRSVPMTSRVKEILKRRSTRFPQGVLFPYENPWLRNQWDRMKAIMKLDKDDQFVPHCLRHTCASRLVQRGLSIVKVQKWMGHKTIQITLRYAHLAPADLLEGVAMLEPQLAKALEQPAGTPNVPTPEVLVASPVTKA